MFGSTMNLSHDCFQIPECSSKPIVIESKCPDAFVGSLAQPLLWIFLSHNDGEGEREKDRLVANRVERYGLKKWRILFLFCF